MLELYKSLYTVLSARATTQIFIKFIWSFIKFIWSFIKFKNTTLELYKAHVSFIKFMGTL